MEQLTDSSAATNSFVCVCLSVRLFIRPYSWTDLFLYICGLHIAVLYQIQQLYTVQHNTLNVNTL
jgi:hypothetical protein